MQRLLLLVCLLLPCSSVLAQSLFPIEVNGRWGYIDVSGKVVVGPKFESAGEFSEGLAAVKIDGKYGFIDATGAMVIEPRYSMAKPFSEGLARVQIGGDAYGLYGKWGFIDRTGRTVIEPQFADLESASEADYGFHDGLAMIERDGLKGFIDKAGNVVIRPRFSIAYSFREGLASVREESDGKWGYIDKTGAWAIAPKFDWASQFSEGLGPVSLNGVCGYVDRTGALSLTPKFKHNENDCGAVWGQFNEGLARWSIGDKFGFINKRGEVVIAPQFDLTFGFAEGLAFVEIDGKYGYVDRTGRMVVAPQFSYAKDFRNGLARVSDGPLGWGYINKSGAFVWKDAPPTADTRVSAFIQPGHTQSVSFMGWSADGKLLASYSTVDGWIKIWNPHTGQLIWSIRTELLTASEPQKSPDGKLLASVSTGSSYEIRDAESNRVIWTISDRPSNPERVTSPDGALVATHLSYLDRAVRVLDSKTNQLIRRLEGHPGIILATLFSPDGKTVATGSSDWTIRL